MSVSASREEGFALPMTIFIVTLVTIMLSALFVRVGVERRIAESSGATVDALAIAHSGLQRFYVYYDSLGTPPSPDPLNPDSLRVNVTGGYADVVAHPAHTPPAPDNTIYLVRSTGHVIEPTQGADPQAERTVAQFAVWQPGGGMNARAAYVAANRFMDPTPATADELITLSGYDDPFCGSPPRPGIRVPTGNSDMSTLTSPYGVDPYPPPSGTPFDVASETNINWPGVLGGEFLPDYTTFTNWNSWSTYLIDVPLLTLTDITGSGLLVVTGDLQLNGALFDWRGVILVGGSIQFAAADMNVSGTVASGLNQLLPSPPPLLASYWNPNATDLTISYNSCRVDSAMVSLGGLAPIPNAWIDNWATY